MSDIYVSNASSFTYVPITTNTAAPPTLVDVQKYVVDVVKCVMQYTDVFRVGQVFSLIGAPDALYDSKSSTTQLDIRVPDCYSLSICK